MVVQQFVNGKLQGVIENCVTHACNTYKERKDKDTNPMVVEMVLQGKPIDHFYYRSDQWVDQPYYNPSGLMQPYVGPADQAPPLLYGKGTYLIDEATTNLLKMGRI